MSKRRVRIGGQTWTMQRVRKMRGGREGTTHFKKNKIKYEKNKKHHEQDTKLHEILHAIFYVAGVGLSRKKEERIVSAITPHLNALIKWKIKRKNFKK